MSKIISFGDSWCYGYELDNPEKECYTHLLSEKVNIDYKNFGENANSFAKICNQILTHKYNFSKDNFVLICIPPDIRYIGEGPNGEFIPLFTCNAKHPNKFIEKQFNYYNDIIINYKNWHSYFQLLNLFCIQEYLTNIKANFLFFTNYGSIDYTFKFNGKIDKSNFLIKDSLTTFLGGNDLSLTPSKLNTDLIKSSIFTGHYFENNHSHPNSKGHKKIADLIYNNNKFQKWLM